MAAGAPDASAPDGFGSASIASVKTHRAVAGRPPGRPLRFRQDENSGFATLKIAACTGVRMPATAAFQARKPKRDSFFRAPESVFIAVVCCIAA
jgi:hypothetical protein